MMPSDLERRIVEAKQKVCKPHRQTHTHTLHNTVCEQLVPLSFSASQGFVPFFVSATAGTTVYGAFDPLIAISDICKKYNIWMHVDVSSKKQKKHS